MKDHKDSNQIFITAKAAAELLGVSRPTFTKIRKQYNLRRIKIGARYKYLESDILKLVNFAQQYVEKKIPLNVFSTYTVDDIEISPNVFDLRMLHGNKLDPYGSISLLSEIIQRTKQNKTVDLIVEDTSACRKLFSIGFFRELEDACGSSVNWNKSVLKKFTTDSSVVLTALQSIKSKGGERDIVESLLALLKRQGFKEDVRHYIGSVIGELCDNSLTHSEEILSHRVCYLLTEKFILNDDTCIVVGIADTGVGIHNHLKTNPKHKDLPDKKAFLEAFRPFVSSWKDEAKRGKGLTDLLTVAMGNRSYFKVDSCELSLFMDFRNDNQNDISWDKPTTQVDGTRFGLLLINKDFEAIKRDEVDKLIKRENK